MGGVVDFCNLESSITYVAVPPLSLHAKLKDPSIAKMGLCFPLLAGLWMLFKGPQVFMVTVLSLGYWKLVAPLCTEQLGGSSIKLKSGRQDSRVSSKASADTSIPTAQSDVGTVLDYFSNLGLNTEQTVAILGETFYFLNFPLFRNQSLAVGIVQHLKCPIQTEIYKISAPQSFNSN